MGIFLILFDFEKLLLKANKKPEVNNNNKLVLRFWHALQMIAQKIQGTLCQYMLCHLGYHSSVLGFSLVPMVQVSPYLVNASSCPHEEEKHRRIKLFHQLFVDPGNIDTSNWSGNNLSLIFRDMLRNPSMN